MLGLSACLFLVLFGSSILLTVFVILCIGEYEYGLFYFRFLIVVFFKIVFFKVVFFKVEVYKKIFGRFIVLLKR